MKISIVTPMYNSEEFIERMILAVRGVDYPKENLEIIVIDNGSSDNSVKIVETLGIKCLVMPKVSIAKMRNAGAAVASGEILAFVDSDCLVDRDWAKNAEKLIKDIECAGIVGGHYGLGDNPGWVERTWVDLKTDFSGDVPFVSAGNMIVKKEVFTEVSGFDEAVETGEDWDFCQRIIKAGYRVVNSPLLYVSHLGNVKSLIGIIKKERWYGRGMFAVLKGRFTSKPILASVTFMLCIITALVAILMQNSNLLTLSFAVLLMLLLAMSLQLTSRVSKGRLLLIIKCIPISFCYVLGRSLSVVDLMNKKLLG